MEKMCDMCGMRPATTFTSYTINGVTTKQCLCSECAKKYSLAMNFPEDNIIASVFGMPHTTPRTLRVCKCCGTTERDVLDNYKFGCSECYNTFRDLVDEITSRMGAGLHIGKRPNSIKAPKSEDNINVEEPNAKESDDEIKLRELKKELRLAVDEERFDDASKLKKQIDKLKAKEDKKNG